MDDTPLPSQLERPGLKLTPDTYNILGVDTSLGCSPYCYDPTTDPEEEGNVSSSEAR